MDFPQEEPKKDGGHRKEGENNEEENYEEDEEEGVEDAAGRDKGKNRRAEMWDGRRLWAYRVSLSPDSQWNKSIHSFRFLIRKTGTFHLEDGMLFQTLWGWNWAAYTVETDGLFWAKIGCIIFFIRLLLCLLPRRRRENVFPSCAEKSHYFYVLFRISMYVLCKQLYSL